MVVVVVVVVVVGGGEGGVDLDSDEAKAREENKGTRTTGKDKTGTTPSNQTRRQAGGLHEYPVDFPLNQLGLS